MKRIYLKMVAVATFLLVVIVSIQAASITRYVKVGGTGDGTTWATASGDLQAMVDLVNANTAADVPVGADSMVTCKYKGRVLVAAGTYTGGFKMREGVGVYGGYPAAGGTTRSIFGNPTYLDGGFTQRVLTQDAAQLWVLPGRWDGFYIQRGMENTVGGAGAFISLQGVIANCIVRDNKTTKNGGGITSTKYPNMTGGDVINCIIVNNSATLLGGGIYADSGASFTIMNCTIAYNDAGGALGGGGVYVTMGGRWTRIQNCIIWGNTKNGGSDMSSQLSTAVTTPWKSIYNCYIQGDNPATIGGPFVNYTNPTTQAVDVVQISNTTFSQSADPQFILTASYSGVELYVTDWADIIGANWNLSATSPCIDKGTIAPGIPYNPYYAGIGPTTAKPYDVLNALVGTETSTPYNRLIPTDINGNPRISGAAVDLGPAEKQVVSAVKDVNMQQISVYPNPVSTSLKLNGVDDNSIVTISNVAGQLVRSLTYQSQNSIDVSGLNKGVYFLKVQTESIPQAIKFVKE
jgi:predicted outer membrane repeat protein